ncbi:MAG: Wzz/FepE/Etk N-terminal domain-containing protein [Candidatus Manganitrophus sp. SB1]|nr:Wzz/FepE/Etk N-terminal domain-containing protein [Candidatus Manganitrophus morganii]
MEQKTKTLRDYLHFVRRRRWQMLVPIILLMIVGVSIAYSLSPVYRSTATILIEEQEVPTDLVRSTVTSYADQRIQTIKHQVMSRSTLLKVIDQYSLYPQLRGKATTEALLKRFADDVRIEVISADVVDRRTGQQTRATIAFTLAYDGETPPLAQMVANELTSLFLAENLRTRERSAQETTAFLQKEAENLSGRIETLEKKIAEFKHQAGGALPELNQVNIQLINQFDRELLNADREIRSLEDRKIYLEGQLATLKPNTPMISADGERILDTEERLKALRAQYVSSSALLSSNHPDMIKMKREIEALEKSAGESSAADVLFKKLTEERTNLAALTERFGEKHPDVLRARRIVASLEDEIRRTRPEKKVEVAPENPAYILIQAQLASTLNDLKSMRSTQASLKQRVTEIAVRLEKTPMLEGQYLDLTRDRDNSVQKYHEIRSKLLEARVAEGLEADRKAERFSLIDPPALPERPEKPNRPAILLLTMVFAMIGGIGYGAAVESLDHAVYTAEQIWDLTEVSPLAVVPYIQNKEDTWRQGKKRGWSLWGGVLSAVLLVSLIHFFWFPLDVIWYAALRKLGLE